MGDDTGGFSNLARLIERRPGAVFSAFLALHAVVWTWLPASIFFNPFMDVIEGLAYGREWQLGYDKLPPLPWWLIEIVHQIFGRDLFFYALSQLVVVAAFACVWAMARPLAGAAGALVAVLLLDGLNYFHFTAVKFNHDVVQLPLWALAGSMYWLALRRGRLIHWVLLGAALGGALWAKYFVVVLALPLVLFILLDRDARQSLATPGPYVALAVALLVACPHLVWLVQHRFSPLQYAEVKWEPYREPIDHLYYPAKFALYQLWYLVPLFAIAAPLLYPAGQKVRIGADSFDRRIVTLLAFGPAAALLSISLLSGRGPLPMWGYPLWLFLGLWCVLVPAAALDRVRLRRVVATWMVVFVGYAVAFVLDYRVIPLFFHESHARNQGLFPGARLGMEISKRYRSLTGQPLTYVIGSVWIGGNVAHFAPERPRLLVNMDSRRQPWIDRKDLRAKGAVIVWTDNDRNDDLSGDTRVLPPLARVVAPDAQVQEPFTLPFQRGQAVLNVGWAILRPQPAADR